MSTISNRLSNDISRFFDGAVYRTSYYSNTNFFYTARLNKCIVIKSSQHNEVPVFCLNSTLEHLRGENSEIIIPLTYNTLYNTKTYKTAHMIFHHIVSKLPAPGDRLTILRSSTGEVFYGASGIILDSNMNPLILATVKTSGTVFMRLEKLILYINPKIFTDNGIISKFIRDKVIPQTLLGVMLNTTTSSINIYNAVNIDSNNRLKSAIPEIVISEDINKFFISTGENSSDNTSEFILNNLEDFITCTGL